MSGLAGQHARGPPPHRPGPNVAVGGVSQGNGNGARQQQQHRQQIPLDPAAFRKASGHHGQGARGLFDPNARAPRQNFQQHGFRERQAQYLEKLANVEIAKVDMSQGERSDKEAFRLALEKVCYEVCKADSSLPKVSLECFGSFQSGFASANSDMDLVIVVQDRSAPSTLFSLLEQDLPRALEKKFLQEGFGARLLTRTRVPIIKVCQSPAPNFLEKLREEREKWDELPNEKKYPHLHQDEAEDGATPGIEVKSQDAQHAGAALLDIAATAGTNDTKTTNQPKPNGVPNSDESAGTIVSNAQAVLQSKRDQSKTWTRERKAGPLDFPNEGVGIQCDINFFNPLGLHNTQLLRCYSLCDPRVRPMVLFVKSWVKQRKINSSYSGTLSSYGFVLMVLHYLMNVAQPPVLPNLQMQWRPPGCTPAGAAATEVDGHKVDFWRNEEEITSAVRKGQMSANKDSLGSLLAGFFQYYSSMGQGPQFRWTQQVLSLRSDRGILSKDAKGWVKAVTEEGEGKKIQHRYLFCIEDPFELSHNVARTVTHNGIVAIRDEFRRAFRILTSIGNGYPSNDGELFDKLVEAEPQPNEANSASDSAVLSNAGKNTPAGAVLQGRPEEQSAALNQAATQEKVAHPKQVQQQAPSQLSDRSTNQTPHRANGAAELPRNMTPLKSSSSSPLDVGDQDAFPTLGTANASRRKKSAGGNFAAISGNAAQAYLDEFRRKKAEAQAESTAMGAAEAVLSEDD